MVTVITVGTKYIYFLEGEKRHKVQKNFLNSFLSVGDSFNKIGHFIIKDDGQSTIKCSNCKREVYLINPKAHNDYGEFLSILRFRYCPICGAKLVNIYSEKYKCFMEDFTEHNLNYLELPH